MLNFFFSHSLSRKINYDINPPIKAAIEIATVAITDTAVKETSKAVITSAPTTTIAAITAYAIPTPHNRLFPKPLFEFSLKFFIKNTVP